MLLEALFFDHVIVYQIHLPKTCCVQLVLKVLKNLEWPTRISKLLCTGCLNCNMILIQNYFGAPITLELIIVASLDFGGFLRPKGSFFLEGGEQCY